MIGQSQLAQLSLHRYYSEKVATRKANMAKTIRSVVNIVQEVLKEVEAQEPRFISTLKAESNGRYEGVRTISQTEFEIVLYLNQMGVFNFIDDGTLPGNAVLKLSDGRKRSMSLWVEFITASGFLSARKIRSRFQTLVAESVEKSPYRDCVKLVPDCNEVKLRIQDKYLVQITCAFRCKGIWPRSAAHWPVNAPNVNWPGPQIITDVKSEGFDLFSKDLIWNACKQQSNSSSMEGDAWAMSFTQAEDTLLAHGYRRKVLSILKCLRDSHLNFHESPITGYMMKTLLLYECEKHPNEYDWADTEIGDRIIGILLQLVSCLQCRRCPHYFLPSVDMLRSKDQRVLDQAARLTWCLVRTLLINERSLDSL